MALFKYAAASGGKSRREVAAGWFVSANSSGVNRVLPIEQIK
jgi:hypothetical protein